MRLIIEEDPEKLQRYAHVRPAQVPAARRCGAALSGTTRRCSLERGHSGPHVAHGRLRRVVAAWDSSAVAEASGEALANRARARRHGGLPSRRSAGFLETLWERALRVLSSPEELFLLVLFVAFTVFAVNWLLLILG